jgi:signal transduction histidine kinase
LKGHSVARFIDDQRDEIVALWLLKVRPLLGPEVTSLQILDGLHLLIDELLQALRTESGPLVDQQRSSLARSHGGQRQQLKVPLFILIREYGLLLQAVAECAHTQEAELPAADLLEISKHLYTAAAEAAEEFAARQKTQQERQDLEKFAFLAHELRTPLGSAKLAWAGIRDVGALDTILSGVLTRNLERLSSEIDQSLVDLRLRTAKLGRTIEREPLDLVKLLHEAADDTGISAKANDIRIVLPSEAPAVRKGSHRLLRAALANLLRNAVKFSRPGGSVEVRARRDKARTVIEVADECGGIPPDKIEAIFDAFTQAGRDRSGFGLGLAIAKQAIEAHDGTLVVQNAPPRGCIFVVDLPGDEEP